MLVIYIHQYVNTLMINLMCICLVLIKTQNFKIDLNKLEKRLIVYLKKYKNQ